MYRTDEILKKLKDSSQSRGSIAKISQETGLPYNWLYKFAKGGIPSPQAKRIEILSDYFEKLDREDMAA